MKKLVLITFTTFTINAFAQPTILNGNNKAPVGTSANLFSATASGIGSAGANQTWDFSAVVFSATTVTWTVVSPASTPFISSFPTANYCWSLTSPGSPRYFYFEVSSTKFEDLADNLLTPGSGNDYTPNSKSWLQFPSNYGDSFTDMYQRVGGSVSTSTVTYDAYGTLITPFATYTNVWRVKQDDGGIYVTYTWENENPFQPILIYNQSNNSFTLFGNSPLNGISEHNDLDMSINLYPNPAKDQFTLQLSELPSQNSLKFNLFNLTGQTIKQMSINSKATSIELEHVSPGIYFYQLQGERNIIKTGKIIVE